MGQLLRITFGSKDYSFQLFNEKSIGKETTQIQLLLEERSFTLLKKDGQWFALETTEDLEEGLMNAICKNISLRYRI
jgi:hypothetical protein